MDRSRDDITIEWLYKTALTTVEFNTVDNMGLAIKYGADPNTYMGKGHPLVYFVEAHLSEIPIDSDIDRLMYEDMTLEEYMAIRQKLFLGFISPTSPVDEFNWVKHMFNEITVMINISSDGMLDKDAIIGVPNFTVRDFMKTNDMNILSDFSLSDAVYKFISIVLDNPGRLGAMNGSSDTNILEMFSVVSSNASVNVFKEDVLPMINESDKKDKLIYLATLGAIDHGSVDVAAELIKELDYYSMNEIILNMLNATYAPVDKIVSDLAHKLGTNEPIRYSRLKSIFEMAISRGSYLDMCQLNVIGGIDPKFASHIQTLYEVPIWKKLLSPYDSSELSIQDTESVNLLALAYSLGIDPSSPVKDMSHKLESINRSDSESLKTLMNNRKDQLNNTWTCEGSMAKIINRDRALERLNVNPSSGSIYDINDLFIDFVAGKDCKSIWAITDPDYDRVLSLGKDTNNISLDSNDREILTEKMNILKDIRRGNMRIPNNVLKLYSNAVNFLNDKENVFYTGVSEFINSGDKYSGEIKSLLVQMMEGNVADSVAYMESISSTILDKHFSGYSNVPKSQIVPIVEFTGYLDYAVVSLILLVRSLTKQHQTDPKIQ